ncbi:hypothetical protein [uncultured Winogradskyella sp.]|uniref:hypothetical protein n=1 Tax=uncultured Winogradskyella sp. TaxID=395353 RepID=UPI002606A783|nr:hypothetical protein [uncultured Winogradskyella sp.]
MVSPNKLKDSSIELIQSASNEYLLLVPGYRSSWSISTFFRFLLFGGSIAIIGFLLSRASEIVPIVLLIVFLIITIILTIVFHTKTKIQFSEEYVRIRYGWLPYTRKRKTKNFSHVKVEYNDPGSSDSAAGGFNYVVMVFSNQLNIKIMMDQLSRAERDFLTGRLNYLKSKFANNQYIV